MPKKFLTDKTLTALRRNPPKGGRLDVMDTAVPGFGVRVNDSGGLTYILNIRFPGDKYPSRRSLGIPGERTSANGRMFTLADARAEATRWRGLISSGTNPREDREKAKREARQRRSNTFQAVAEDFIAALEPTERGRVEVAQAIRREYVKRWGTRPVVEISPLDVLEVVKAMKNRGHPHQARNLLGHIRRLFSWAIAQHAYGLERSPCAELRPKLIIGKKLPGKRYLQDDEIRAAWNAAGKLPYPYGPCFRLLMLSGQRRSEIADARWSEIDEAKGVLVIPPERMKTDDAHAVPLGKMAQEIIAALPRFDAGDYLFSSTYGKKPINGFSKPKQRLDAAMAKELGRPIQPFTIRDLRRTVRTNLSALPIPQHVAERMIAHAQPGIIQTYNLWSFMEEKRQGFELWEARLRGIIARPADNVVALRRPAQ